MIKAFANNICAVFLGGAVGALLRYFVSVSFLQKSEFPFGTFAVNILGCFSVGFVFYTALKRELIINPKLKLFLNTGIAGGLTTFSTFSYENVRLLQNGQILTMTLYLFLSIILGMFFAYAGLFSANRLLRSRINAKRKHNTAKQIKNKAAGYE